MVVFRINCCGCYHVNCSSSDRLSLYRFNWEKGFIIEVGKYPNHSPRKVEGINATDSFIAMLLCNFMGITNCISLMSTFRPQGMDHHIEYAIIAPSMDKPFVNVTVTICIKSIDHPLFRK